MKSVKLLCIIMTVCLIFSALTVVSADEPTPISATLTANKQIVKEGEHVEIAIAIDYASALSGGKIEFSLSESFENIFSVGNTVIKKADGIDGDYGAFTVSPSKVFDKNTALFTLVLKVKDSVVGQSEKKDFKISVNSAASNIKDTADTVIPLTGNELTISIEPNTISGTIDAYGTLNSTGITAQLKETSTGKVTTLSLGGVENGKIVIQKQRIEPGTYKLEITGDGFIKSTSDFIQNSTVSVHDFYPGDVNNDSKIDFFDFHALCVFIYHDTADTNVLAADLNRDGKLDQLDADCLLRGCNAKEAANNE